VQKLAVEDIAVAVKTVPGLGDTEGPEVRNLLVGDKVAGKLPWVLNMVLARMSRNSHLVGFRMASEVAQMVLRSRILDQL
jgi:hypothetical protein